MKFPNKADKNEITIKKNLRIFILHNNINITPSSKKGVRARHHIKWYRFLDESRMDE